MSLIDIVELLLEVIWGALFLSIPLVPNIATSLIWLIIVTTVLFVLEVIRHYNKI